jgi:citrate lyase gamma subunit
MTAVQAGTKEELPDVIRSVMEAVKFRELDIQIEDAAEKGAADLRLKTRLRRPADRLMPEGEQASA